MIPLPVPNTRAHPYRGLSVQEVDFPLTEEAVLDVPPRARGLPAHRLPRAAVDGGDDGARRRAQGEPRAALLPGRRGPGARRRPTRRRGSSRPETDVGNATSLAGRRRPGGAGDRRPRPLPARELPLGAGADPVRVTEVVPPYPPKLFAQAQQVVAYDEDLPPVTSCSTRSTSTTSPRRTRRPATCCRAADPAPTSGARSRSSTPVPRERHDWTLIGCERSLQFHRHFYGDEPPRVDLCPRKRVEAGGRGRPGRADVAGSA